ncbi:MAG: hypothetical protein N4A33_06035 [Bacteriovoracaceae bacterium]|jgi:tetratricopeptide (TPR) repeat protein|nr:hypothetical protein [Bacteriovoracaceae bacterium]
MILKIIVTIIFCLPFCDAFAALEKEELYKLYTNTEYESVVYELNKIQKNRTSYSRFGRSAFHYLRGSSYLNINEFEKAKKDLLLAIKYKAKPKDIYYKLGQTYFALDEYKKARGLFKKSIQVKFNRAVSLYYAGFCSTKLRDYKSAVNLFHAIEKIPEKDKKEVIQASRMQIADIYYEQAQKKSRSLRSIKKFVIPQYEYALGYDEETNLADDIRNKIKKIQQKYELLIFKMRNGRDTAIPRYFVRGSALIGTDSNVNQNKTNKESSSYYNSSLFARYSFYPNNKFSIAPEIQLNYLNYLSSEDSIKANNTYSYSIGGFVTYDHYAFKRAATTYLRFSFGNNFIYDVNESGYDTKDTPITISLSEEVRYFKDLPSTFRYIYIGTGSNIDSRKNTSHSFVYEQLMKIWGLRHYLFTSYTMTNYDTDDTNNTRAFTIRDDLLLSSLGGWVNLSLFTSFTATSYPNNSSIENLALLSYGINFNKPFLKKWYANLDVILNTQSGDSNLEYNQNRVSFSLDYIY